VCSRSTIATFSKKADEGTARRQGGRLAWPRLAKIASSVGGGLTQATRSAGLEFVACRRQRLDRVDERAYDVSMPVHGVHEFLHHRFQRRDLLGRLGTDIIARRKVRDGLIRHAGPRRTGAQCTQLVINNSSVHRLQGRRNRTVAIAQRISQKASHHFGLAMAHGGITCR
jgi:hypothetical protein